MYLKALWDVPHLGSGSAIRQASRRTVNHVHADAVEFSCEGDGIFDGPAALEPVLNRYSEENRATAGESRTDCFSNANGEPHTALTVAAVGVSSTIAQWRQK